MLTFNDNDWTRDYEHVYTLREVHEGFGLSLGLTDYPIFDEEYRNTLNNAIYQHFCYRQIAADTPQLFVFYLNRRMREQMPTYNAIYKKLLDDALDPFGTYVHDANGNSRDASTSKTDSAADSTNKSDSKANSVGTTILSNTPASFMDDPYDPKYMSSLTQAKNDSTSTANSTGNSTSNLNSQANGARDYIDHATSRVGYLGDAIVNALATGFLNTDLMVCDMLEPCFIQLWNDQPLV
jgi:hypothetical protein